MIANTIRFIVANFPLIFFITGLFCALIKVYRHRINITNAYIIEAFTVNYLFWSLGISFIYHGIIHIAFPGIAANYISQNNIPLRLEVGIASLGLGITSLMAFKKDFRLRLGAVIATSVFLWSCAGGHLYQLSKLHDNEQGKNGFMFWVALLQPVISITLLYISYWFNKREKPTALFTYQQKTFIAIYKK